MHLIFNTLSVTSDGGGIKTYLTNIISALANLESKPEITLICSRSSYPVFKTTEHKENIRISTIPVSSRINIFRIFLDQVIVPLYLFFQFNRTDDILITPSSIATIFSPLKQITIIQAPLVLKNIREEVPADFLGDFSTLKKVYYDTFLPKTVEKSEAVITVSGYLKKKLLELHQTDKKKIFVVYEGVDFEHFNPTVSGGDENKSEILFVSTLYSYKNADKVIKAFGQMVKEERIPDGISLRIIGNDPSGGERLDELQSLAAEAGVQSRVMFDGYIPHRDIGHYYYRALMFIFPSSVETFGLPPLEAMACGVPVIASNRMSVPEIVGNAGLIIDPDSIEAMVQAIEKITRNNNVRRELIKKGYERARQFQWSLASEQILETADSVSKNLN